MIAAILPWATLQTAFGSISRGGMDDGGDGIFTAILGIAGGIAAYSGWRIVSAIAGLMIAGIGYLDIRDVSGITDEDSAIVTVGPGLYLTVLAGVVMFLASTASRQKPERHDLGREDPEGAGDAQGER